MNVAILLVEGGDEALDVVLNGLALVPDSRWTLGEKRRSGRVHSRSGFSSTLADEQTPRELMEVVRSWLVRYGTDRPSFKDTGLKAELSVGFTVGESKQFVAGVEFSPAELGLMSALGISLTVTAYPTSDEANSEEERT